MSSAELHSDLTLIILAGGKSSRMGQDKGFLKLGDDSFVKKLLEAVKSITPNILISVAKANGNSYKGLGFSLVVDELEGKGPLGGITSALKCVKTQWFGLLTVDSPFLTKATLEELWINRAGKEAVVYTRNQRIHPLVALYHSSTIEKWQMAMDENQLRVTALVESFDLKKIELSGSRVQELKNINTPQEYQAVVAKVSMEIKVLYFGEIAEWKGCTEEFRSYNSSISTNELVGRLVKEIPQLEQINYAIAVNQNMIDAPVELLNGYEVSVFPPFAGG